LTGLGRGESLAFALGFGLLLGLDGRYDLLDLGGFEVLQGEERGGKEVVIVVDTGRSV
jgi:hypothetical protein